MKIAGPPIHVATVQARNSAAEKVTFELKSQRKINSKGERRPSAARLNTLPYINTLDHLHYLAERAIDLQPRLACTQSSHFHLTVEQFLILFNSTILLHLNPFILSKADFWALLRPLSTTTPTWRTDTRSRSQLSRLGKSTTVCLLAQESES